VGRRNLIQCAEGHRRWFSGAIIPSATVVELWRNAYRLALSLDHEHRSHPNLLRHLIVAIVELLTPRARLVTENLLLRRQLVVLRRTVRCPRLKSWERRFLSAVAVRWTAMKEAIAIVKPATLLPWHRAAWRWWWRQKSKRPPGRPPISADLRALIRRLWR